MSAPSLGRGRGRGRGSTLPAWMTHGEDSGGGVGGSGVGGSGRGSGRGGGVVGGRPVGAGIDRDPRGLGGGGGPVERLDRDARGGGADLRRDERGRGGYDERERGYRDRGVHGDRDGGRHHPNDDRGRDRGYDRDRDRDYPRDRDRDFDRDRGYRSRDNSNHRDGPVPASQRGHRGLGYDERASGRGSGVQDREISWERDRGGSAGMGRGRGRGRVEEMNFVRGEVYDRDRDRGMRDRDFRERDRMDDRDQGRDRDYRDGDNFDRDMDRGLNNNSATPPGMGRGRGRGRGVNINKPAWMTEGPVGIGNSDAPSKNNSSSSTPQKDNETMEKLLAQARQVQKEQTKRDDKQQQRDNSQSQSGSRSSTSSKRGDRSATASKSSSNLTDAERAERRRKQEADEAAKKAEEERKRLEQLREEEERRQLLALVGEDLSEDDEQNKGNNGSNGRKRKDGSEDEDAELFEFETEEEREERLARKRREERRKKLRKLEENKVEEDVTMEEVDKPRNVAGVVQSELNDGLGRTEDVSNSRATNVEVDTSQVKMDVAEPNKETTDQKENDSDDDSFDIFATDNATPVPNQSSKNAMTTANSKRNTSTANNAQECDDAEGYYKANIGEIITLPKEKKEDSYHGSSDDGIDDANRMAKFRVLGIIGKGVFSSVIKCVEETPTGTPAGTERVVAMKIIRNNEVMAKAAAKELRILRILCHQKPASKNKQPKKKHGGEEGENGNDNNPTNNQDDEEEEKESEERERQNHFLVRLLDVDSTALSSSSASKDNQYYSAPPPEFRSHCVFLFEFLPYNLREVLSKFGKNVGINLTAVRSYARQLLCALAHLERHRVVHADLKPDNILVSANFSTVKLADFGSAFFETDHDNDPTPYLVSRFYRPPEVILGLEYDRMVDLWSTSVTLAELFTGSVLFPGKTNNDMLVRFMDAMGPLSHKMVKRHALSYVRMGLQPHFEVGITGGTYQLRKMDNDRVTGEQVCRLVNVLSAKADARLAQVLLRASKGGGASYAQVLQFADFLNRCLALDPARRLSIRDALKHDFFMKKKKKEEKS